MASPKVESGPVRCLTCSHEWQHKNIAAKKKKCPVCGKYRIESIKGGSNGSKYDNNHGYNSGGDPVPVADSVDPVPSSDPPADVSVSPVDVGSDPLSETPAGGSSVASVGAVPALKTSGSFGMAVLGVVFVAGLAGAIYSILRARSDEEKEKERARAVAAAAPPRRVPGPLGWA